VTVHAVHMTRKSHVTAQSHFQGFCIPVVRSTLVVRCFCMLLVLRKGLGRSLPGLDFSRKVRFVFLVMGSVRFAYVEDTRRR
jgi:hypothetical protein